MLSPSLVMYNIHLFWQRNEDIPYHLSSAALRKRRILLTDRKLLTSTGGCQKRRL